MKMRQVLIVLMLSAAYTAAFASTNTSLPFTRFVRQVQTGPSAVIATESMAEGNAANIKTAGWTQSDVTEGTIPPINFYTNTPSSSFDAYKYVSDYANGTQKAYAGMVAYRYTTPASAISQASDITSVTASIHCDRWLIGGVRVAIYNSSDVQPSEDWATLREGDAYAAAILPDVDPRADQSTNVTITLPGSTAATNYIWVVVSLEDYASVSPLDVRRLEGGANMVGQSISVVFSAASVTNDVKKAYAAGTTVTAGENSANAIDCVSSIYGYSLSRLQGHLGIVAAGKSAYSASAGVDEIIEVGFAVDGTSEGQVYSGYTYRWGTVGTKKRLSTMSIEGEVPASHANTINRLVVYAATDGFFADNLSAATLANHAFWNGTATSVTTASGTFTVRALVSQQITGAIAADTEWPVVLEPDHAFQLIVAMSPEWLDAAPASISTSWTVSFTPGVVTFTE